MTLLIAAILFVVGFRAGHGPVLRRRRCGLDYPDRWLSC